jgi:hypothetical protein
MTPRSLDAVRVAALLAVSALTACASPEPEPSPGSLRTSDAGPAAAVAFPIAAEPLLERDPGIEPPALLNAPELARLLTSGYVRIPRFVVDAAGAVDTATVSVTGGARSATLVESLSMIHVYPALRSARPYATEIEVGVDWALGVEPALAPSPGARRTATRTTRARSPGPSTGFLTDRRHAPAPPSAWDPRPTGSRQAHASAPVRSAVCPTVESESFYIGSSPMPGGSDASSTLSRDALETAATHPVVARTCFVRSTPPDRVHPGARGGDSPR